MTAKALAKALFFKMDAMSMNEEQVAGVIEMSNKVERELCKADARKVLVDWAFSIYETNPGLFIFLADDIDRAIDERSDGSRQDDRTES